MDSIKVSVHLNEEVLKNIPFNKEMNHELKLILCDPEMQTIFGAIYLGPDSAENDLLAQDQNPIKTGKRSKPIINSSSFRTTFNIAPKKTRVEQVSVSYDGNRQPVLKTQGSVTFGKDEQGNLICPICKKSFTLQLNANRHFTSVHNKISYKCELCDYACRKDYLKVHAMKSHGMNENMVKFMMLNCKQVQR